MKTKLHFPGMLMLICLLGFTSCSSIISGFYGIKKRKLVDEKIILQYSKKYDIPIEDSYELDTSYISFLSSLDSIQYKTERKNHSQPLQVLYYDQSGHLQSYQINCYAGGFPNIHWDRDGIMTSFPPGQQAPLDSILPFETQLKYLNPLSQTKTFIAGKHDYVVVLYWNKFMGRQSKRLIRTIQDNSKLATDKRIKIIYANNDNIFARQST